MKKLLLLFVIPILTAVFLCFEADKIISTPQIINKEIIFKINKGDSLQKISQTLETNGLINNSLYFYWYAKLLKIYPNIKAGEYMIDHNVNYAEVADLLQSGKFFWRKVTIPEGLTVSQIREILQNNEFLQGEVSEFADGEILPETYTFMNGETRENIIKQAKNALQNAIDEIWENRDENIPLKSKKELLILASIIEKETGIESERTEVASVFINRLKIGMRLQTDPTVIYALTKGKTDLGRPLYRKDLDIDSPYNTYKYAGLPPSPICAPGRDAIYAAAHPANTNYLYFVASGSGGHNFASSLSEHNKNVSNWRKVNK